MNNIKVSKEKNSNTIDLNNNLKTGNSNFEVIQSNDLKGNSLSKGMRKSPQTSPRLNEDTFNMNAHNQSSPKLVPIEDLELLQNPKKSKNHGSSSEDEYNNEREDSDDEHDDGGIFNIREASNNETTEELEEESIRQTQENNNGIFQNFFGKPNDDSVNHDDDSFSDLSNASGVSGSSSRRRPPPRAKTMDEIMEEKQELLYRLDRLGKSGYPSSKKYNINSNLEEIRGEYNKLKKQRDVDKSIKFSRKALMAFSSGVEFLNNKFDPFDFKLEGWSESMYENLGDYDEIFEELHEKYKEKVKMPPEIRLLMMVGGSAFMFHLTNTLFKSKMPGLNDILKQNPDLMRNVKQAAMNTMQNNMSDEGSGNPLMGMMMNNAQQQFSRSESRSMKGPSGVDDILNQLNTLEQNGGEADGESTTSSIGSDESLKRRKIQIKKKDAAKNNYVINMQ
jgi:hypothetical protein